MIFIRRWSRRSKALLVLAAASGVGAYALVDGYAARLDALAPVTGEPVPVVVAAVALARGDVLEEGSLEIRRVPSAFAPPGRIGRLEDALGRTLVSDLAPGEAVTRTRIGLAGGPVAALVPQGLRAFPISAATPPGAIRPGDRVDVLATFGGPHPYADTVASGLEVLTIIEEESGAFAAGGAEGPSLVLLVGAEEAEELAFAAAYADVSVALRAPSDDASA